MDDPWGSSQDTWSSPKPTDSLPIPDSFKAGYVANEDTVPPLERRRSSNVSDPWGTQVPLPDREDTEWNVLKEEGSTDEEVEGKIDVDEELPSKSGWLDEDDGNAWAAGPVPVEEDSKTGDKDEDEHSEYAVAPPMHTPEPDAIPPSQEVVLDSPPLPPQDFSPSSPTSAPPRLSNDSDSYIPRSNSHQSFPPLTPDDDIDHNPFSSVQSRSSTPLETLTSTPPALVTVLPLAMASPSLSEGGFGGFSDAAPDHVINASWGSPSQPVDDWGISRDSDGVAASEQEDEEIDAWGGSKAHVTPIVRESESKEDDWDSARRAAERREARAPTQLVGQLEKAWPSLVMQAFSLVEDEKKRDRDEMVPQLDAETITKRDRLASELIVKPHTLEYFTPWKSTQTYARCSDAAAKAPINAVNSLLAQADKRSAGGAGMSISQLEKEWNVRSKLGEPDTDSSGAPKGLSISAAQKPGWSIFGRKPAQNIPLTTSGGGMLEVKTIVPENTGSSSTSKVTPTAVNAVSPSVVAGIMSPSTTSLGSRPASPAPSTASGRVQQAPAPTVARTSGEYQSEEAPSAVGRFFGRFRRNRPVSPSVDLSNQDMQLSNDDFSFLAEVPSVPPTRREPGIGDLLGGNEDMNSLEHVLNSRATPLPPALSPPPSLSQRQSTHSVSVSMKPQAKELDLFADLDFNGPSTITSLPPPMPRKLVAKNHLWDDMMTPAAGPSSLSSPPRSQPPPLVQPDAKPTAHGFDDDDGFGDFTTIQSVHQASSAGTFNDFGDFFGTSIKTVPQNGYSSAVKPAVESINFALPPKPTHVSGLDATFSASNEQNSIAQFVNTAAKQTDRWPAPASPVPPLLAPPPSRAPAAGSFDFFANEPSEGSATARKGTPGLLSPPPPSSRPKSASPAPMPGGQSAMKLSSAVPSGTQAGKAGLSAQDLSFFDSL